MHELFETSRKLTSTRINLTLHENLINKTLQQSSRQQILHLILAQLCEKTVSLNFDIRDNEARLNHEFRASTNVNRNVMHSKCRFSPSQPHPLTIPLSLAEIGNLHRDFIWLNSIIIREAVGWKSRGKDNGKEKN